MQTALVEIKGESILEMPQFSTNEVLKQEKSNRTLYYLPCYVRFKVKQIESIDIEGLQGLIAGTFLFSFYYGNLEREIVDQFVNEGSKAILIQFARQESLQLREDKGIVYKEDEKQKLIDFVVRQDFVCNLAGDVFYTPFEIINLYLTITVQSVVLDPKLNKGRRIDIKFNCMTSKDVVLLGHSENCMLGNYQLAKYFLDAKYRNSEKNPFKPISVISSAQNPALPKVNHEKGHLNESLQEIKAQKSSSELSPAKKGEQQQKIKNFQYVHFRIPLYKYPGASLVSIFIPLWILGFINLLIFFQDITFSTRIGTIATLTLAFIAFIPTINEQIPQTPYVKLVEILVYMQTFASVLCLVQSLSIQLNKIDQTDYKFDWTQDGFFISALILNLITAAVVFSLFIIHKCFWEKIYVQDQIHKNKVTALKRKYWSNPDCDKEFEQHIRSGRISVV